MLGYIYNSFVELGWVGVYRQYLIKFASSGSFLKADLVFYHLRKIYRSKYLASHVVTVQYASQSVTMLNTVYGRDTTVYVGLELQVFHKLETFKSTKFVSMRGMAQNCLTSSGFTLGRSALACVTLA